MARKKVKPAGRYWNINENQLLTVKRMLGKNVSYPLTDEQLILDVAYFLDDENNADLGNNLDYPTSLYIMHSVLVPHMGSAPTVAGQLVRAINCLAYRFLNDGDVPGSDEIAGAVDYLEEWTEYSYYVSDFSHLHYSECPARIIEEAKHERYYGADYEDCVLDLLVEFALAFLKYSPHVAENIDDE